MESWPGAGLQPFDRGGLHPRDRSGPWRDADLRARVWHAGRRYPARAGYARRGGYYAASLHGYADSDSLYSFQRVDYEAIQHVPLGRDRWVLSLRGKVETTYTGDGHTVPYFMMPSLGGGSDLRGFSSWRFRDLHSLLLQAEWRVLVNAFFDTAIFYDAGKVTNRRSELDFTD